MTLPKELIGIFDHKIKTYKMVLILSILAEMRASIREVSYENEVSYEKVKERFLNHFKDRLANGKPVDPPPRSVGESWNQIKVGQVGRILDTPIKALSSILEYNNERGVIGFKQEYFTQWNEQVMKELEEYAWKEIEDYYVNNTPRVWWVNQGVTFEAEKKEGILWASTTNTRGGKVYHWETMTEVKEGDIVLHYSNGAIRCVSQVTAAAKLSPKPASLSGQWGQEGRLIRTNYYDLNPVIPLDVFSQKIKELNITQGPIDSSGRVKQGYLFRFTQEGLQLIQKLAPNNWPKFTIFSGTSFQKEHMTTSEQEVIYPSLTEVDFLNNIKQYISWKGFYYPHELIDNFYLSLKSKPFVILAGVSGTGKTKLVKLFAEAIGATEDNGQFVLIPVRPDWSDPTDLIGYKDLSGRFKPGPLTEVLLRASQPVNRNKPYFICLDEMNLARVEHYFSDMLSILESHEWRDSGIVTAPIIRKEMLETEEDKDRYGDLSIPDNVYIVGTVNMDETTHPFSKKVLDRANTIEFNDIDLNHYPELEETVFQINSIPAPNSFLRSNFLLLKDVYVQHKDIIQWLTDKLIHINRLLEPIHACIGFRIRDTIAFYLIYNKQFQLMEREHALDFQIMQKILPRIQGSSFSIKRALLQLLQVAVGESWNTLAKNRLEDLIDDASTLYDGNMDWLNQAVYPRTARKLVYMIRRLEEDGFTSYWLA